MFTLSKSALEDPLRKMFPEEWLRKTARETQYFAKNSSSFLSYSFTADTQPLT